MKEKSELQVRSHGEVEKAPAAEALFEEFSIVELEDRLEFHVGRCNGRCAPN
jgi:hypothetical protein